MLALLQELQTKESLGILAGVISAIAYVPYVISIFKRQTKPSRSSWWIWSLIGLLILLTYRSVGAISTIWVPLVFFIAPAVIAVLSLRFGENTALTWLDKICLLGAAMSMIFWLSLDSAAIALYINIFMDLLGFVPTLTKTYARPLGESKTGWILFFVGSVLNVLAIDKFVVSIALYPIYMFSMDILMLSLLYRKRVNILNPTIIQHE